MLDLSGKVIRFLAVLVQYLGPIVRQYRQHFEYIICKVNPYGLGKSEVSRIASDDMLTGMLVTKVNRIIC